LSNSKYANIKKNVTKNQLNAFINSPNFKKTWNKGRGQKDIYRSKEIIKALYDLPLNKNVAQPSENTNVFYNARQSFNKQAKPKFLIPYGMG